MAQFFRGNYGSALGRVDTRPIIEAGRAQGQMYAQAGKDIGGMIKEYGLNKQKREEMTNEIESALKVNPDYLTRMTSTGIEADDKKAQTRIDKLAKGELKLSELKGLAGELALMEKQDLKAQAEQTRLLAQRTALLNQQLTQENIAGKQRDREEARKKDAFRDNYFTGLNKDLDEALDLLKSDPNAKLEPKFAKLVANQNMVRNKQGDLSFYQSDPTEDELKKIEKESAELGLTKTKLEVEEKQQQPEFATKEEALSFAETLPEGVSARISSDKDGFKADLIVSEKARMEDFAPIPGYDNYYQFGQYIYEGDPSKGKLRKVGSETYGQDINLLIRVIDAMETPSLVEYENVKSRSTRDGDNYVFVNPQTQEEVEYPYNESQENKLRELNALRDQLSIRGQNVLDLRTNR
jgi:hypothetical protein